MTTPVASFGMYPFAAVRADWDRLWAAIRGSLTDAPAELAWDRDLHDLWHDPGLLLGHTCGWPLVTELAGEVAVVGAFDVDLADASDGHYRSVVVAAEPRPLDEWRSRPDTVVAINNSDSLSGWVSMCAAWGSQPPTQLVTGAHYESLRAIARGDAHVAAIDGVSFTLIGEHEPQLTAAVHVIGHGPRIPCLPIITAGANAARVPELRAAVAAALADPDLAGSLRRLHLRGFVPLDGDAYGWLLDLAPADR